MAEALWLCIGCGYSPADDGLPDEPPDLCPKCGGGQFERVCPCAEYEPEPEPESPKPQKVAATTHRRYRRVTDEERAAWRELYRGGKTYEEIGLEYDRAGNVVRQNLLAAGIKSRAAGKRPKG